MVKTQETSNGHIHTVRLANLAPFSSTFQKETEMEISSSEILTSKILIHLIEPGLGIRMRLETAYKFLPSKNLSIVCSRCGKELCYVGAYGEISCINDHEVSNSGYFDL